MMNLENSSNTAENIFTGEAIDRCREDANFRKIDVTVEAEARVGKPLIAAMTDKDGNSVICKSEALCEIAEKIPTSPERIRECLLKFGGSPYNCKSIEVVSDEGIILPISAINATRRALIEEMNEKRIFRETSETYSFTENEIERKIKKTEIYCEVTTPEQYRAAKRAGIKNIIAPPGIGSPITKSPLVSSAGIAKGDRVYASTLGAIDNSGAFEIIGGHRLNITNSYSADFYSGYMSEAVLSPELSLKEVISVTSATNLNCGVIAYGRLDLMLCGNCPVKAAGVCRRGKTTYFLKDRKGEKFPILCSDNCTARILNSKPLYMADKWQDIENSGVGFALLVFTTETENETEEIINKYIRASQGFSARSMPENTFTRGHFYRGIM